MAQQEKCEATYSQYGICAQRPYPNQEFVRLIGRHFIAIPQEERFRKSVLEIGCGTDANLWMLAKVGFVVHRIDFASTAVALCRKTMEKWDVRFQCDVENMLDLSYPDCQFDAVSDVFSATHLPFFLHERVYQENYRVFKPVGVYRWANQHSYSRGRSLGPALSLCTLR